MISILFIDDKHYLFYPNYNLTVLAEEPEPHILRILDLAKTWQGSIWSGLESIRQANETDSRSKESI